MISIQLPNGKQQNFSSENELGDFCAASFQKLSRATVESLRDSLGQLAPIGDFSPQLCAALGFEATKCTVLSIESHRSAKKTPIDLKKILPLEGHKLAQMSHGSPNFLDVLPSITQLHASAVGIHDSMHTGPHRSRVDSNLEPHTAIHVLGHLAQIIMYLPQLRPLVIQMKAFLRTPVNLIAGIIKPQPFFIPDSFSQSLISTPANPHTVLQEMVRFGGSLHLK